MLVTFSTHSVQPETTKEKLLVLGDSLSAAYGMQADQGWVSLLSKKWQTASHAIEVVNASVSGETTTGALARLPDILRQHQPDWIIIELGGNDGLQGKSIKQLKQNLTQLVEVSQKMGASPILFEIQIPPNYGKRYTQAFTASFSQVANEKAIPLVPFFLSDIAIKPELMQKDGIHPNEKAQPEIADKLSEVLLELLGIKKNAS
ncbi:arylesterase [Marinifaba aquimaris]|uniref:arylesterase n=1 Tax=Marinifaba aquimaris TaxID=2741323 RepID=UPI001FE26339|nr:arylesterase [Marinifaba aquimaris]